MIINSDSLLWMEMVHFSELFKETLAKFYISLLLICQRSTVCHHGGYYSIFRIQVEEVSPLSASLGCVLRKDTIMSEK